MSFRNYLTSLNSTALRRPSLRRRPSTSRLCLETLEDRRLFSTFTVLNLADNGADSLRAAILAAAANPGSDVIEFAAEVQGTIPLTSGQLAINTDVTITGPGATVLAVSGSQLSRIFSIGGGATVAISGLTIKDGMTLAAPRDGGGILNTGSTLTLNRVVLSNNQAVGVAVAGAGRGGAIANMTGATLSVIESLFTENQARGGAGGIANCGGIFNFGSTLTVSRSAFLGNQALGGSNGGSARGGAIDNANASTATVTDCSFISNQAVAADGGTGQGFGRGGALYNFRATLSVANCNFLSNLAQGGSNITRAGTINALAAGAGVFNADGGILSVSASNFIGNKAVGGSGGTSTGQNGHFGTAFGAGLHNSEIATVSDSVFMHNEARGGSGNRGDGASFQFIGTAMGGAISNLENQLGTPVSLTLNNVKLMHNRAIGGDGNTNGTFVGAGIGGGIMSYGVNAFVNTSSGGGTVTLTDSAIAHNHAIGGTGTVGGNGVAALGGGVANLLGGVLNVSGSTLSHNRAQGGAGGTGGDGGDGLGGGIYNGETSNHPSNLGAATVLTLADTRITHNDAFGGDGAGGSDGEGSGGGVYNLGLFDSDGLCVVKKNDASASNDDLFDLLP